MTTWLRAMIQEGVPPQGHRDTTVTFLTYLLSSPLYFQTNSGKFSSLTNENGSRKGFFTTDWGVVRDAGVQDSELRLQALERLVKHYRPTLEEYLFRQFRLDRERVQDTLQAFFLEKVIEKDLLTKADQTRGKFRTFLLQAINGHVLDQIKAENAKKRRPEGGWVSIEELTLNGTDFPAEETREVFDDAFTKQLIAEAIQRTHQYCLDAECLEIWEIFHARILGPLFDEKSPTPYPELVAELKLRDVAAAQNRLGSAKRIFRRQLEALVQDFTSDQIELANEMEYFGKFLKHEGKDT